jgi:predicted DNA-binding transcriptional regulator YafY
MNRTDRLYAITEELRRAGPGGSSGPRLARLLEVSERTIKRDVAALQQSGAPIRAQAGPGGGYVLDGSASLPPVNFTPGQAVALAVALAALPPGSPFGVDGAAARGKVFDALRPDDRRRATDVAGRVWFGDREPAPGAPTGPSTPAPVLRAVERSLSHHLVLAIRYRARSGTVTRRSVEPILLARTPGGWHLVGWAPDRGEVRWFRLDRIEQADVTREAYHPRDVAEVGEPPPGAGPAMGDR